MTSHLDAFLDIADWQGWQTAVEDISDDLGDGVLAVAVRGENAQHVGVLADPDSGLITYVSMRWRFSDGMGGKDGRLWRDLNEDDHGGLFATAVGWLMQPQIDPQPRTISRDRRARIDAVVTWCPACGTRDGCVCDSGTPGWDALPAWEPQEIGGEHESAENGFAGCQQD